MDNLNDMLQTLNLADIENHLNTQFGNLQVGYYDAKLAVMLSMIVSLGIQKLDEIKTSDFPSELNEKFRAIKEMYEKKTDMFRQHLEENAKIIRAIDKADTDYPKLESRITELLSEFDALIKTKVLSRDTTPISEL